MGKSISDDEARKLELNLLIEFAEYCEKKNLRYALAYGTLIGAIRHKGFIPWDNDIDVVMPRPDYEKFIKEEEKEKISSYMECLDYHETRTFPFAKLIDKRTCLKEHFLVTEDNMGVYIDIFPLDGFPDSEKEQRKLFAKAKFWYKMFAFANYRFNTGSNRIKWLLKCVLYPFSRLVSNRFVCERLNHICKKYPYDESRMVGNIVWGFGMEEIIPKHYMEKEYGMFENEKLCIPKGYDGYLRQCYGDYMKLPPEEERIVHAFEAEWKD